MTEPDDAAGVGVPDGLERLWTPHRIAYIEGENKPDSDEAGDVCPFCRVQGGRDDEGLIVRRGKTAFAVLNLYPYNPGHLLVCPYRHVADYTDLNAAEVAEVASLTRQAMVAVRATSSPYGFNLGINQGRVAGAGISAHLHQHVVPRWGNDSNFITVIAKTRTVPQLLAETRELIASAWPDAEDI